MWIRMQTQLNETSKQLLCCTAQHLRTDVQLGIQACHVTVALLGSTLQWDEQTTRHMPVEGVPAVAVCVTSSTEGAAVRGTTMLLRLCS
jgi:hypothetical protein